MTPTRSSRDLVHDVPATPAARRLAPVLVSALAIGLVSAPGAVDSPLGGAPLDLWGYGAVAIVAAGVAALFFFPPRSWHPWVVCGLLGGLIAVKLVAGSMSTPLGWTASYDFGDTKGNMHRARFFRGLSSVDSRWEPDVVMSAARSDLHFFNDVDLFGYPPYSSTPREREYPLAVTWTAVVVPRDVPLVWTVVADGAVSVTTDGGTVSLVNPLNHVEPFTASREGGRVVVRYHKRPGADPHITFSIREQATNVHVAVVARDGTPTPTSRDVTTGVVVLGLTLLVVGLSAGLARSGTLAASEEWMARTAGLTATLGLIGWGTVVALRWHGGTSFLGAGGDPLYYGSSARDILHHGILMLHGTRLGQASPFYFYPLYPYLLAGGHALFGDTASAAYLTNGLLQACLPPLFLALGWRRLRPVSSVMAFAALCGFLWTYQRLVFEFDQPSFTDIAYMTAVFASLAALTRAFEMLTPGRLVVAGAVLALGAATRPSLMTLVYLAPLALALGVRPFTPGRWLTAAGWLVGGIALGLLPFTLRNLLAAGKFVVLVNSWIQIPYFLIPPEIAEKPGGMPGLLEAIGMAWDIFRAHPARTVIVEARKLLYTLGITAVGPREMAQAGALAVLPPLYLWALIRRRLPFPASLVVSTFAVSHVLAMFIAAPWTFHYKSILPLHAALLFGAAFLLPSAPAPPAPSASCTGDEAKRPPA